VRPTRGHKNALSHFPLSERLKRELQDLSSDGEGTLFVLRVIPSTPLGAQNQACKSLYGCAVLLQSGSGGGALF
jgi:hypothetical protein